LYLNLKYDIWLVVEPTPLKNMKVSWDDEIPNIWEKKKNTNVPNHQPIVNSPVHVWTLVFLTRFYDFAISAWDVGLYIQIGGWSSIHFHMDLFTHEKNSYQALIHENRYISFNPFISHYVAIHYYPIKDG
jgi:hypothetical protein